MFSDGAEQRKEQSKEENTEMVVSWIYKLKNNYF